eukprot:m.2152 g.2152  ORF g.2152 m.2152 type:complete len:464 (+) comp1551_c0_seq1:218-1609(+)
MTQTVKTNGPRDVASVFVLVCVTLAAIVLLLENNGKHVNSDSIGLHADKEIQKAQQAESSVETYHGEVSGNADDACRIVSTACKHRANESVQTKLNTGAGTWVNYTNLELHRKFAGFDYDDVFANNTLVSRSYWCTDARALRMRNRMWIPEGCTSLSERRYNLTVLPPGIRVLEFGNSYMGQYIQSLCVRAAAKGEVTMIESITNPNTDLLLAEMETNGSIDWTNYAEYRVWHYGDPLPTTTEARAYDRYVMKNGATLVYAHNKQSLGLPEALTLDLMLNMSGWNSVSDIDVLFVSRGNSINWALNYFYCNELPTHPTRSTRVCDALMAKKRLRQQNLVNLHKLSDVLRARGFFRAGGLLLTSPEKYIFPYDPTHAAIKIHGSDTPTFDWNSVFKSQEDFCGSDAHGEPQPGHQCMPGVPDAISDVFTHVIWEDFCARRQSQRTSTDHGCPHCFRNLDRGGSE